MPTTPTAFPDVATREEWLAARKKLLAREREVTHLRDAVNAERRRLPMVKVEKDYVFEGPDGELRLIDMFEGRPQLYIHHFMWIDAIDEGCPSCTMAADLTFTEKDRALLNAKGVTFAAVSRAPYASIARYKGKYPEWTFPWYSSCDNDFSYDYHVTLDPKTSADRVQLQVDRRVARRRVWRRRSPWGLARSQRVRAPWRRGVPYLFGLCPRAWTIRRRDIRSSISRRTAGKRRGRTRLRVGHKVLTRWEFRWTTQSH